MSETNCSLPQQDLEGSPVSKELKLSNPDDFPVNAKGN